MAKEDKTVRFESINGLRTIACLGIVLMHVLANINYSLSSKFVTSIIDEFTNFVLMFMTISAFAMCRGYYNKIKNNEISPVEFYSKRVSKILPFFIFLSIISVIVDHNMPALYEAFANSTLLFGLINKSFTTIGVGWFLGLVFIFYLMFPYFTYLFRDKKSAWITTLIALLMNITSILYFGVGRSNMFYSFLFFCIGGLLYLHKDSIISFFKNKRYISLIMVILSIVLFYLLPLKNEYLVIVRNIIVIISFLLYAISFDSKLLNNKVTSLIGGISFEIYLCHMVIFRIAEKLKITKLFSSNDLSYILLSIVVICGAIVLSLVFRKIYSLISRKLVK